MSWIRVGVAAEPGLPREVLTEPELKQLRGLLDRRGELLDQAQTVEREVQLLLLLARDRRGLVGKVGADPETGALEVGDASS
jgi:hypothetical protein